MARPFEHWPNIMTVNDVIECTGLNRDDVYRMFKNPKFPLIIPEKRRGRTTTKNRLWDYLNGTGAER